MEPGLTEAIQETEKGKLCSSEYSALRDEIVKRLDFQHRLVSMNLVAAGAFLVASEKIGPKQRQAR